MYTIHAIHTRVHHTCHTYTCAPNMLRAFPTLNSKGPPPLPPRSSRPSRPPTTASSPCWRSWAVPSYQIPGPPALWCSLTTTGEMPGPINDHELLAHADMHARTLTHTHAHIQAHTHIHTQAGRQVHRHTHAHTHARTHAHTRTHTHMHTCTVAHIDICACTYTCCHTHTHKEDSCQALICP